MAYEDLFQAELDKSEAPKTDTGYADLFGHALQLSNFPGMETIPALVAGAKLTKQALTPDTQIQGVAAGEFERSPQYPTQAMTDVSPSDLQAALLAGGAAKMGLSAAVEAMPKIDITPPAAPPEPMALPRPFDVETTAEPVTEAPKPSPTSDTGYRDLFGGEQPTPKAEPTGYKDLFDASTMKAPVEAETPITEAPSKIDLGQEVEKYVSPGEGTQVGEDFLTGTTPERDVLRPDNLIERTKDRLASIVGEATIGPESKLSVVKPEEQGDKPFAVFRGAASGMDYYDFYNVPGINSASNVRATFTNESALSLMKDKNVPLLGKVADAGNKQPTFQLPSKESGQVLIPSKQDFDTALTAYARKFDISGQYDPLQASKAEMEGSKASKSFQDELDIRNIEKGLSKVESEAMHYYSQNIPPSQMITKTNPVVAKLALNPTPAMQEALAKYKPWAEQKSEDLKINPNYDERQDYAPNILNYPIEAQGTSQGKITGQTPFTQHRTLESLSQAEDMGYTRKFSGFGDTLRAYSNSVNKAVEEQKFVNRLKDMKDVDNNQVAYPKDDPKRPLQFKDGASLSPLLKDYVFSPQIYDQLRLMKGLETPTNVARALETADAIMKKAELSLGIFHYMTVAEGGLSLGVNPVKLYNMLAEANKVGGAAFVRPELTKDFLQHNGVITVPTDIEQGLVGQVADHIDRAITYAINKLGPQDAITPDVNWARNLAKPVDALENMLDRNLWHNYVPSWKILAYEHNVAVALANPKNANVSIDVLKRQVADSVNNFLGGQPWNLLMNNPKYVRALQQGFISADWTVSNIRVPLGLADPGVKGQITRRAYWKLGLLFLGLTELGTMFNKKIQGEKNWYLGSLGNDTNHKFDMFLYRDKNGMAHYAAVNKAFTEPYKYFTNPIKAVMHKLAPKYQLAIEQGTGHTSTGYDLKFQRPGARLKSVTSKFVPFITSGSSFAGTWPMSQAISITDLKEQLTTAVYKDDQKAIDALKETAQRNGLGGKFGKILSTVKYEVKGTEKYEIKKKAAPGALSEYTRAMTGFNLGDVLSDQFKQLRTKINTPQEAPQKESTSNEPF